MKKFIFAPQRAPDSTMQQAQAYQGEPSVLPRSTLLDMIRRDRGLQMVFQPVRAEAYSDRDDIRWQYCYPPSFDGTRRTVMPVSSPLPPEGMHYREEGEGLVQKLKNGEKKPISNVRLRVKKHIVCHRADGTISERYVCEVYCPKWEGSRDFEVEAQEVINIFFLIKKQWPQATLYQNSHDAIEEYISEVFSSGRETWEQVVEHELRGWTDSNGSIIYAEGCHPAYRTAPIPKVQEYTPKQQRKIIQEALQFLQVGHEGPEIAAMFLFAHLGFSGFWLQKAGIPCRFCLFLSGKTGSLKTSVAMQLANVFETVPAKRVLRITGTSASLKTVLMTMNDGTAFVDDFSNSEQEGKKKGKTNTEMLLRMVGDGIVESKMDGNAVLQGMARFGLILAGETEPDLSQSSVLRYLPVRIHEDTFDETALDYFQRKNSTVLRDYFALYIRFIEERGQAISKWVQMHLPEMRNKYADFTARRIRDMAVVMEVQARCIVWMAEVLGMERDFIATMTRTFAQISVLLERHETESRTLSASEMFLAGVFGIIQAGNMTLAGDEKAYVQAAADNCLGFYELPDYIWLDFARAYQAVRTYWETLRKDFLATEMQVKQQLADSNMIMVHQKKGGGIEYLLRAKKGKRPRMMVLRIASLKGKQYYEGGK